MKSPWRWLIAINAAIMVVALALKIGFDLPHLTYIHLLVDYHFGFAKRALIGALLSLVTTKVPPWMVFALGGAAIAATLLLYLKLFQKTFGFSERSLPLLVFLCGSPMFFKNFIKCVGYFDIYGCMLAIVLLLVPAQSLGFLVFAVTGSVVLLLIHHIHMLLYLPTIAAIVIIRHFLLQPVDRRRLVVSLAIAPIVPIAFILMQFGATVPAPREEFTAYLASRMGGNGMETEALAFVVVWYQTLSDEIALTSAMFPQNLKSAWFYALLIGLHAPLIGFFRTSIRAITSPHHRAAVLTLLGAITLGYVVIFITVFDYARWFSSWGVCMILMLHAVRMLPGAGSAPMIDPGKKNVAFASVLTVLPRVGITQPF